MKKLNKWIALLLAAILAVLPFSASVSVVQACKKTVTLNKAKFSMEPGSSTQLKVQNTSKYRIHHRDTAEPVIIIRKRRIHKTSRKSFCRKGYIYCFNMAEKLQWYSKYKRNVRRHKRSNACLLLVTKPK